MDPETTAVIKHAAPMSSPTAKLAAWVRKAAKVEKTSGLPLPKASSVTPAKLSLMPRMRAMVLRLTQKKSLAAMPMVLKRRASQSVIRTKAMGLACGRRQ
jgi:hypothetical protein